MKILKLTDVITNKVRIASHLLPDRVCAWMGCVEGTAAIADSVVFLYLSGICLIDFEPCI